MPRLRVYNKVDRISDDERARLEAGPRRRGHRVRRRRHRHRDAGARGEPPARPRHRTRPARVRRRGRRTPGAHRPGLPACPGAEPRSRRRGASRSRRTCLGGGWRGSRATTRRDDPPGATADRARRCWRWRWRWPGACAPKKLPPPAAAAAPAYPDVRAPRADRAAARAAAVRRDAFATTRAGRGCRRAGPRRRPPSSAR